MNIREKIIGILLAIIALLGGSYTAVSLGGTAGGTPATVATSSSASTVAGTARILFATSTSCSARIITTQSSSIKLTFSDYIGDRPTGNVGHIQTASTTVEYNAEDYGCGAVWAYPYGTEILTLTETR